MEEWFAALTVFEKIYWVVAGVSSIMLLILTALTLIGGDSDGIDGDVDAEIDADTGVGFQFLSFKNLMGFLTIFSWSGISCIQEGYSKPVVIIISIICGLLMMLAMATLFYYLSKLQSSGTLKLKNALDQIGEVYLTIGPKRTSIGKVSITVQGSLRELDALTDADVDLKQGDVVKVKEITENGILIVEQLNK